MMISKKFNVLLTTVFYLFLVKHGKGENMSDQDFLDNYDEIIRSLACEAEQTGPEMKVNLSRYSTREELAKMAFWNFRLDLSVTKLDFGDDLKWKRDLVDVLFDIFKKSCPNASVPYGYVNIFREFTMIYLNSFEPEHQTTNNSKAWENIQDILVACKDDITTPYEFISKAMKITGIRGQVGAMIETTELYPPEEKVDVVYSELDQVIDNFWWVFSHAIGKCYPKIPRQAEIVPNLRALFLHDIMYPMLNRWGDPGPLQDFGPIVGNYNIATIQRNIRFCVTAGYFRNGITDLQMVRPLRVGYVHEGRNSILNRKTGATFQ